MSLADLDVVDPAEDGHPGLPVGLAGKPDLGVRGPVGGCQESRQISVSAVCSLLPGEVSIVPVCSYCSPIFWSVTWRPLEWGECAGIGRHIRWEVHLTGALWF